MFKRFLALLICLLLAGSLSATAETGAIILEDAAAAFPDGQTALPDGAAVSIDVPEAGIRSNDGDEAQPVELSVKKSCTKNATLGTSYQVVIPGKTIKTCKSSDKKVATVTKKGLIQTKKAGTAKITVTPKKGSRLTIKLRVIDPNAPTAVVIDKGSAATMDAGDTLQLTATVSPETAPQAVSWKTGDSKIATVTQDGLVTALAKGETTITATTANDLSARLKLTVRKASMKPCIIVHAMGGIGSDTYTNSLEAFRENYARGHRIFEIDLHFTSDGKLVLWHSWDFKFCSRHTPGYKPSYKEFMGSKIYDKYTPMDLKKLLKLIAEYPDIRVVVDGKYGKLDTAKREYKQILSTARDLKLTRVLNRMIVELYNEDMYKAVKKIYPFPEYMMVLYKAFTQAPPPEEFEQVARYCEANKIGTVVMDILWEDPQYVELAAPYGVRLSYYTVNDAQRARELFDDGIVALFSDFLPPLE